MQFSFDPNATESQIVPTPFLPSFDAAVAQNHYSLRLPAYRSSYARRYHPYPRYSSPRSLVNHFTTALQPIYDANLSSVSTLRLDGDSDDSSASNLQEALSDGKDLVELNGRVRRFSFLVIDLALCVRRALRSLRSSGKGAPFA